MKKVIAVVITCVALALIQTFLAYALEVRVEGSFLAVIVYKLCFVLSGGIIGLVVHNYG